MSKSNPSAEQQRASEGVIVPVPLSDGDGPRPRKSKMDERSGLFWAGVVFGATIAIATTLLIAQNTEKANLDWLWFDFNAPLWWLLFLSMLSGVILGRLVPPLWRRGRARIQQPRNQQPTR